MAPLFQSGKYGEGVLSAVQYMGGIISNDEEIMNSRALSPNTSNGSDIAVAIFFAFFFFVLFMMITASIKAAKSGGTRPRVYVGPSVYHGGGNAFGGGGFGGGGFSGGGGGFGGGGASGGW